MRDRAGRHSGGVVAIDGVRRCCGPGNGASSACSRGVHADGVEDDSVIYAFDLESMEPVCGKV